MKVNSFIVVRKNYKNSQFRAQIVELCRSGIFSDQQLLDQLKISRTSLRNWHRHYIRYRKARWFRSKPAVAMKKEADQIKALKQQLAAAEKENQRLTLKNEGLEIMIDIAENHGAARAVQDSHPKKVWPRWRTTPGSNSAQLPASPGKHESIVRAAASAVRLGTAGRPGMKHRNELISVRLSNRTY